MRNVSDQLMQLDWKSVEGVKGKSLHSHVIPAQAGIQYPGRLLPRLRLDSRLRGNEGLGKWFPSSFRFTLGTT